MKRDLPKGSLILLLIIVCAGACKKSSITPATDPEVYVPRDTTTAANQLVPYPETTPEQCDYAPAYGDSIVFPQPASSGDYYVYPKNNQGVSGTYLSWPGGLILNSKSGAIDLTKSETGMRYSIGFVKEGTSDTCISQLIVGGAAYMDSVYVLSESAITSKPYFNADPNGPPVCQGTQGEGCKFDYNNYAKNQGIEIDQNTGFIDLQKTMEKSPFGLLPINGTTVYTTIYYKLNDNSNFAPQKIQLQMVYYNHKSDIPSGLVTAITNSLFNTLNDLLLSKGSKPRPPLIIITRTN